MKKDFYLGHDLKKKFRAMVFSLLMDYKNKTLELDSLVRIKSLIDFYSGIDASFVQRTIKTYELKTGISMQDALKCKRSLDV